MDLRFIFSILRRWAWLIIVCLVLGLAAGFAYTQYETPVYRANTQAMIVGSSNELEGFTRTSTEELVRTYTQLLLTGPVLQVTAERLGYTFSPGDINVGQIPRTTMFQVSVEHHDPQKAADIANTLVLVLIEQNDKLNDNLFSSSADSLEARIARVEEQMSAIETQIAAISQESRSARQAQLEQQIAALETEISNLRREIANLSAPVMVLNEEGEEVAVPLTAEQQLEITEKQIDLEQLEGELALYQQAYFDLTVLNKDEGITSAEDTLVLSQLITQLDLYQQIYSNLISDYETTRAASLSNTPGLVQVDEARAPNRAIRPRPVANILLGLTLALVVAASIIFVVEYLDDSVKSSDVLESAFEIPVIGHVLREPEMARSGPQPFSSQKPRSPFAESLRSIRTNLEFAQVDAPIKTLLVTSANPSEGKTTLASNLAVVNAQAGKRVILVDADLRNPRLHKTFESQNDKGLTGVLVKQYSIDDALQSVGQDYLKVLSSGPLPPNPGDLLKTERMSQVLEELCQRADLIIIDAPPAVVADAAILAAKADGVLIVVRYAQTRIGPIVAMMQELERARARVIGFVMNGFDAKAGGRYYYYDYGPTDEKKERGWFSRSKTSSVS